MSDLQADFERFHRDNPRVYEELVRLARQAVAGRRLARVGIGMLWEVLRWHFWLQTTDVEFKLNNNHRSRYARLIMDSEPDLRGVFETRGLKS